MLWRCALAWCAVCRRSCGSWSRGQEIQRRAAEFGRLGMATRWVLSLRPSPSLIHRWRPPGGSPVFRRRRDETEPESMRHGESSGWLYQTCAF